MSLEEQIMWLFVGFAIVDLIVIIIAVLKERKDIKNEKKYDGRNYTRKL